LAYPRIKHLLEIKDTAFPEAMTEVDEHWQGRVAFTHWLKSTNQGEPSQEKEERNYL